MKLTTTDIELPEEREMINDYTRSGATMQAVTKKLMSLRKELSVGILSSENKEEQDTLYEKYWQQVFDLYVIERDISEIARFIEMNDIKNRDTGEACVDVGAVYRHLRRNAVLNHLPFKDVHVNGLSWTEIDFMTVKPYLDSWWPFIFIELKDDPREVLKKDKRVKFVNITNQTKIKEEDWHSEKEAKGVGIIRRVGEVPTHSIEIGGVNIFYIYVKDNPSDKTKTVYFFGVPWHGNPEKPEVRVYPLVLEVKE